MKRIGGVQRSKTELLRRYAVVEISHHFLPKAVVRLAVDAHRVGDQNKPRLSPSRWASTALVNDLGPRIEVGTLPPLRLTNPGPQVLSCG